MKTRNTKIGRAKIFEYVQNIVGDDMHAKRVLSLVNVVEGIIYSSSLALSLIGKALAVFEELNTKHAIKQVDRFFSNAKVSLDLFFFKWIPFILSTRKEIVVVLDWTDYDKDGQATLALNLLTGHGRATPLLWKTYKKTELKDSRNTYEDLMLGYLKSQVGDRLKVTILADRGFSDTAFFSYIKNELEFDYIIRTKNNLAMNVDGITKPTKEWLLASGRATKYINVKLTHQEVEMPAVICVHNKKMKEAWFLATSLSDHTARSIVKLYSKRFTVEENFRDIKNLRFGMGLSEIKISNPERRDRVLMAASIAISLLTILGAAGEALGFDRLLKANTVKRRTHSLLNQGLFYFKAMINYNKQKLTLLIDKFTELINQHEIFKDIFGTI
jgi:Transposase DDE domain